MSRAIKRVPLNFDWPMDMPWKGYMSPYTCQECKACVAKKVGYGEVTGLNKASLDLYESWYNPSQSWCFEPTDDEVRGLTERFALPPDTPKDGIVHWLRRAIVGRDDRRVRHAHTEIRAKRLGVWGLCPHCGGDGRVYFNEEIRQKAVRFSEDEAYEPPTGEGWQMWETVSEGSPISPVFPTQEAFKAYLLGEGYSPKAVENFLRDGSCVGSTLGPEGWKHGVETASDH